MFSNTTCQWVRNNLLLQAIKIMNGTEVTLGKIGTSLAVQWLRFHASNSGGTGSIPGRGTKILHTTQAKMFLIF